MFTLETGLDRCVDRLNSRRDTLDHWSAALARGDDAAVERLVQQSRIDRIWVAASGQLGPMLG
jgi:hypothetical protein